MPSPKNFKDITGSKFYHLTAIRYVRPSNGAVWVFRCECGVEIEHKATYVKNGAKKSCGCKSVDTKFKNINGDIVGVRFHKFVVVKKLGKKGHDTDCECLCDCGKSFNATITNIRASNHKSCGCHRRITSSIKSRIHGMSQTKSYVLWNNMHRRCYDKNNDHYNNYGGRGIDICERWHKFENFYADMGEKPKGRSLDRIDNNRGYSPDNCRWATFKEQGRNTRSNKRITIGGEEKTVSEWAESSGVRAATIYARIVRGWQGEELLSANKYH